LNVIYRRQINDPKQTNRDIVVSNYINDYC
jgi:hypothetical protein